MEETPESWLKTTLSDRYLGFKRTDVDEYAVYINEQGLKRAEKELIEREIYSLWRASFPDLELEIQFRPRAKPVQVKSQKVNPLGVEIRRRAIPGVHKIIAVSSGKGGVGKSTLATNLAVALAQSEKKVGLLDCDVYGPSAPTMLGNHNRLKISEDHKLIPVVSHGVKIVSFGNLSDASTPLIWRGPLASKAFEQLCYDVDWGELDFLILDLPPGTGDIQLTMIEKLPVTGAIIVSTPQDIALIDVAKGLNMFRDLEIPIIGIVENMSTFVCTNCGHEEHIFGTQLNEFASANDIRVLTRVPLSIRLRQASDSGNPLGRDHQPFADIADLLM